MSQSTELLNLVLCTTSTWPFFVVVSFLARNSEHGANQDVIAKMRRVHINKIKIVKQSRQRLRMEGVSAKLEHIAIVCKNFSFI